jgi:Tol biopolymer transport system component
VVAYSVCPGGYSCRIWVVNDDGTGAHELLPDELGEQGPLAWSADGSELYYHFAWTGLSPADGRTGLAVTDAIGSAPRVLVDAGNPTSGNGEWCPRPFADDNCGLGEGRLAVSPDGTRLAYAVVEGGNLNISTIVVLDVSSGQIIRLESTRTLNPRTLPEGEVRGGNGTEPCAAADGGYNGVPQWSPDGTALVFIRLGCRNAVFTVNADDTDLRELAPLGGEWDGSVLPRWSPDGSSIVFSAKAFSLDEEGFPDLDATTADVYTVRPDGTGLQALTSDGVSIWPFWTRDGRIVTIRLAATDYALGDLWIMDADGGHATQLQATVPALTAAGCVVCPYPVNPDPDPRNPNPFFTPGSDPTTNPRLWQLVQEDQQ